MSRVIKPDEDGPTSTIDTHGRRDSPACVTKAKFSALRKTDFPPPIGATPISIQAACSEELGANGNWIGLTAGNNPVLARYSE